MQTNTVRFARAGRSRLPRYCRGAHVCQTCDGIGELNHDTSGDPQNATHSECRDCRGRGMRPQVVVADSLAVRS